MNSITINFIHCYRNKITPYVSMWLGEHSSHPWCDHTLGEGAENQHKQKKVTALEQ